jgi:ubiquinone/menaquinone biosynthesis C-methylase UbiE
MSDSPPVVNHHADHPGFSGMTGTLYGLIFLLVGRRNARQANEIAGVGADDHVIDIGCGPGNAARRAARRGARVTGVDPSQAMLRVARAVSRGNAGIVWAEGSAEAIPVPDGAATLVWSLATVHHWRDVTRGLAEVLRVLAPGGRLLVVERRSPPDATGVAGHGWTAQQSESFAVQCRRAGMVDVTVETGDSAWVVLGYRP